jgi:hypothetical protein
MWVKDLNVRPETLKLLQERIGNILEYIGTSNNFLNINPVARQFKERVDKREYIKLKSFCTVKQNSHKTEETPQSGRKSLPAVHLTRG